MAARANSAQAALIKKEGTTMYPAVGCFRIAHDAACSHRYTADPDMAEELNEGEDEADVRHSRHFLSEHKNQIAPEVAFCRFDPSRTRAIQND